jgi:hypothetical protein
VPLLDTPDPAQIRSLQAVDDAVWWELLANWPELAVWVAANRSIPPAVVACLAAHPRTQVRAAIASNAQIDEALMLQLAHDKSDLVRMRIACNAQASRAVLAALVADSCVVVSKHAEARLKHDISGVLLPASYLDEVSVRDLLH